MNATTRSVVDTVSKKLENNVSTFGIKLSHISSTLLPKHR
jgi:hypothetical protein